MSYTDVHEPLRFDGIHVTLLTGLILADGTIEGEIASGQSLYYKADEDPEFLKHTFAYPHEIEGAEALWEFLRPMLSKGQAKKIVTAKDADGNIIGLLQPA